MRYISQSINNTVHYSSVKINIVHWFAEDP